MTALTNVKSARSLKGLDLAISVIEVFDGLITLLSRKLDPARSEPSPDSRCKINHEPAFFDTNLTKLNKETNKH